MERETEQEIQKKGKRNMKKSKRWKNRMEKEEKEKQSELWLRVSRVN